MSATGIPHPLPKDGGLHSEAFLEFVRSRPCKECGRYGVDPHHYPSTGSRGGWRARRDDWTIPLCRKHHDQAQQYVISAAIQERWVLEVRSEFMALASPEQFVRFAADRRLWIESRPCAVEF